MENFILLGAIQNTLFFVHKSSETYDRKPTYHLFYAAEFLGLIKSKEMLVSIFEISDADDIEMVSLQHKSNGDIEQFELSNLTELYNGLCKDANEVKTLEIIFDGEKGEYNLKQHTVDLSTFWGKNVSKIQYVLIDDKKEKTSDETTENSEELDKTD